MTRIIVMGPPGVGKGTQASRLATALGVPTISTGELFREHVRDQTAEGVRVQHILEAGDYVPDELTNAMVDERLGHADAAAGFILDGYPRTLAQVSALDEILATHRAPLDLVILLEASVEVVLERLAGRATKQKRADDSPAVIRRRIAVYEQETAPLTEVYAARRLLRTVDASGTAEEVASRLRAVVSAG
jgi:adenylate kinase